MNPIHGRSCLTRKRMQNQMRAQHSSGESAGAAWGARCEEMASPCALQLRKPLCWLSWDVECGMYGGGMHVNQRMQSLVVCRPHIDPRTVMHPSSWLVSSPTTTLSFCPTNTVYQYRETKRVQCCGLWISRGNCDSHVRSSFHSTLSQEQ